MFVPKDISELQSLIENGVEESQQLEYKAAKALLNLTINKDIAKDVSAMANASGGVIIYGIQEHESNEKKHKPEKITAIQRKDFSKERLIQIINSNISPRIEGIVIHPISLNESEVVYVVEIPQSTTAHQSTQDCVYYKRYNFEILKMQDYEIRDIMNRIRHPKIEIDFEITKYTTIDYVRPEFIGGVRAEGAHREKTTLTLYTRPHNIGSQYAQFINYFLELPITIIDEDFAIQLKKINDSTLQFYGENTIRDVLDVEVKPFGSTNVKHGPSRFDPLLPGLYGKAETITLNKNILLDSQEIKWKVYADNAPINSGSIKLNEITYTSKKL